VSGFAFSQFRSIRAWVGLAAIVALGSCIEWDRSTAPEPPDIREFVSDVLTLSERPATFNEGTAPVGGAGPILNASLPELVLKGGAAHVTFSSDGPFERLIVSVQGRTGHFDLLLDEPTTSATVLIVYAQETGAPTFTMHYAGVGGGALGPFQAGVTSFLGNGTGDVQVNVTWNTEADVDLYVVDPFGEEYFYNHRGGTGIRFGDESPITFVPTSGGILDIDSNAGCGSDGPRAENVFWPAGVQPPEGAYVVRVNYWAACGAPETHFVVTIRARGQVPQTYTGSFTGAGVGGASGAGVRIAEFTFNR
jgi:hypothetical protein